MDKKKVLVMSLVIWNFLNLFDALFTFFLLKFELVYDANKIINWLNIIFGRSYIFLYFFIVAFLINFFVVYFREKKVRDYVVGALIFYSFIILLAVIQNVVLIYEWVD